MAERRMFSKVVIDSDSFMDLPLTTQALYFHLAMRADDDGFISNPRKIQRMIGTAEDDMKILIAKGFLLQSECGVVVVRHWRVHNTIRADRYKPTLFTVEKSSLILDKNGVYQLAEQVDTIGIPSGNQVDTIGIPNGNQMETQYSIDKNSVGKDNKNNMPKTYTPPTAEEIKNYSDSIGFSTLCIEKFISYYSDRAWQHPDGNAVNWRQCVRKWRDNDGRRSNTTKGNSGADNIHGKNNTDKVKNITRL